MDGNRLTDRLRAGWSAGRYVCVGLDQGCAVLVRCHGDLRRALVCLLSGASVDEARLALAPARGNVREALASLGHR